MAGTPPQRADPSTPSGATLVLPRTALEYLPLPLLIFEPTLRLNFVNAAARRFFGLDGSLHNPETFGLSAVDLFGDDVRLADPEDPIPGEGIEVGEWNERIRMLECRRRHRPDSAPISVRAAVGPFLPGTEYFASPQPSASSSANWHSVVLLSMPSSPVSSSASTATPNAVTDGDRQRRRGMQSPYAQFAASASARTPFVLRGTSRQGSASQFALSPSGRSVRSVQGAIPTPGSFFPGTPASATSVSTGSTTSSSAPLSISSYAPSTANSTAPSVGGAPSFGGEPDKAPFPAVPTPAASEEPPVSSMPPTDSPGPARREEPAAAPRPVRPAPGPSKTSPAAAVIAQIRAADRLKEQEREQKERAEEDDRREALSRATVSPPMTVPSTPLHVPEDATLGQNVSPGIPGLSPSHPLTTLTHSVLSHLPRTGLILASKDLSGGYVNAVSRELLLGIRPQTPSEAEAENADWLTEGIWIAQPGPGGKWTWDGAEFFRGLDANAPVSQADANDSTSSSTAHHESSIISSDVSVGLPTQLYKMTVATILQRSVKLSKVRSQMLKRQTKSSMTSQSGAAAALSSLSTEPSTEDVDSSAQASQLAPAVKLTSATLPSSERPPPSPRREAYFASTSAPSPPPQASTSTAPPEPPQSQRQTRKPYKVYDATFNQRIIDPLEPLLEMCARRGQDPDASLGGNSGMTIGLEVEMPVDTDAAFDTFEMTSVASAKRKVRRRLVEVKGVVIRHPNGAHLGGMLVLRDVTDERVGDSRQKSSPITGLGGPAEHGNAYFKQILDQMPQMVWTTTPQGSHDYFNNQWYEYTGLEPEQSLGLGWQNPFHDDDMPHTIKAWSHSLATGDPYSVEYRCRRHDGAWRWMLGRALPMRDSDGKITGWFGTCTDIEDAVEIRAQLVRTREQFISVLSGADVTIISTDLGGVITLVEGADAPMLRQRSPFNDPMSKLFVDLWPQDQDLRKIWRQVELGQVTTGRLESVGPNGRPYRVSIRPRAEVAPDGKPRRTGYIIVCNDVADLRDAETALKESVVERTRLVASETAAKEASRLKSAWLANTTHEIRTPISAMVGLAELLLDDEALSVEHRDSVEKIVRSCEILLDMVGMVLDMGKVEAGKLELDEQIFFLDAALADARIFSHVARRKGLEYHEHKSVAYEGPLVGDMSRLRQILGNLLSNAIKFTSEGSIDFYIDSSEESDDGVVITFVIADTGVGIKAEAQAMLFQPFHQADSSTSRKYGGTGLGLSIVKSLVELMGGKVSMQSTWGQGTTMTVVVRFRKPTTDADRARAASSSPPKRQSEITDRSSIWILLAEDNQLNREIVVKLLQRLRFNVKAVENGHRVLEVINERKWDLILMDGQMPDLDGYETTRRLRSLNDPELRQLKIVALTASAIQGDRERCLEAGMDDYLAKPVRLKDLETVILKHLGSATDPTATQVELPSPQP